MAGSSEFPTPTILPLGDSALLVRFAASLTEAANGAAIALTRLLDREPIAGVVEVVPNLISVMLRYDPLTASPSAIAGELRLRLFGLDGAFVQAKSWTIPVRFDGEDLADVSAALKMTSGAFVEAHNRAPLRVLATGFAPGFVYCGMHHDLVLPRRTSVRAAVPAGSVLFAAGQTAICATEMPTGWHVIGHTDFANFRPDQVPPTQLSAGDSVQFEVAL